MKTVSESPEAPAGFIGEVVTTYNDRILANSRRCAAKIMERLHHKKAAAVNDEVA